VSSGASRERIHSTPASVPFRAATVAFDQEKHVSNPISRTASTALGGVKDGVRNGVARWVPSAVKAVGIGAQLAVLRDGSRKVANAAKRNPVATTAIVAAAVGAGIALWLMRRNRQRRGYDEELRMINLEGLRLDQTSNEPIQRKRVSPRPVDFNDGE